MITIASDQNEGCAELPITDDNIALENDETFEVLLQTPPGVTLSSPSRSTVTILDNDGMFEGARPHNLLYVVRVLHLGISSWGGSSRITATARGG